MEQYAGFLECKKVGVEQTVNSGFKKSYKTTSNGRYKIPFGSEYIIRYAPRGAASHEFILNIYIERSEPMLHIRMPDGTVELCKLKPDTRFIFALTNYGRPVFVSNDQSLRSVNSGLANCRILEVFDIADDGVIGILNNCLAGPQTPEKAKQASFVALDARKRRLGTFDRRDNEADFVSILVLTETSHWEAKSIKMIEACIDYNLSVSDGIIIEAFREFEREFGSEFYNLVSKESYRLNREVQGIANSVVSAEYKKMFYDMKGGVFKKIAMDGNSIRVIDV